MRIVEDGRSRPRRKLEDRGKALLDNLNDISPERREAVRAALALCTRGQVVGPIARLKGGVSGALIYRVDTGRRSFALRIEPERIALEHRRRGFACMEAAAAIKVAPQVFFADPTSGIAVMDFIEAKPIATHPGGRAGVVRELGALVARLQTTKLFPRMPSGDEDMIASALKSLEASGLFAAGLLERHRDELARIRAAVPWDPLSLVSSHNDPNPAQPAVRWRPSLARRLGAGLAQRSSVRSRHCHGRNSEHARP